MKIQMGKRVLTNCICLLFSIWILVGFSIASESNYEAKKEYQVENAIIIEILDNYAISAQRIYAKPHSHKEVNVRITSGKRKNQIFRVKTRYSNLPGRSVEAKIGSKVLVRFIEGKDNIKVIIVDYDRERYVYRIVALFFILLIGIGKIKGVKAIISLSFTLFMILYVLLPLLVKGYNPIISSISTAIVINIIVFFNFIRYFKKIICCYRRYDFWSGVCRGSCIYYRSPISYYRDPI